MKKIGILGGLAWPSTIEYYQLICELSQEWHADKEFTGPAPIPEICIESVNINTSIGLRGSADDESSWRNWDQYLNRALKRLETSGAEFAIIASNTPHNRFDAITTGLNIPVLSVFDAVATLCEARSIDQFLLLGTAPTMSLPAYAEQLKQRGITCVTPSQEDQREIVELIGDLYRGETVGAADAIEAVVERSFVGHPNIERTVCLACTELPLAFAAFKQQPIFEHNGTRYINTAVVHATAAFNFCVEESS